MNNNFRTFFLMTILTVLFVFVGGEIGGGAGALIAFLFAAAMNFYAYWFSDKMVLKQYRAQEALPGSRLYNIVEKLTKNGNLPMPKVYTIPERTPNAFATGRNPQHAAVVASEGIINLLGDDELAGVMAHELTHVKNRDILTGTIAATIAGSLAMMGQFARFGAAGRNRRQNPLGMILILVGAPLAGMIIRSMISRTREYAADAGGAKISHKPLGLASALNKISAPARQIPLTTGNPAHSHMFIVTPFFGVGGLQRLFATHPPIEDRIRRLEEIARTMQV
ncbi:MAG: zinc metalloprotease HtpX [Calditrichaeota bacterium]|nr:zinc metalloprotease HtpX [Calditrichota bacterium]